MAKYKLIEGVHVDDTGKPRAAGETFESQHDLMTMFPRRFELIGGEAPGGKSAVPSPHKKSPVIAEEEKASKAKEAEEEDEDDEEEEKAKKPASSHTASSHKGPSGAFGKK
jgi:hypothetical protein